MTTATAPSLSSPAEMLALIQGSRLLAFDLETTGLNQRTGRVRLLSLSDGQTSLVMDCFEHPLQQILPALTGKILLAHNALFDLGWLWNLGLRDLPETVCTFLLAQLLTAGEGNHGFEGCGLAACCKRWLSLELPKELQRSDWSGPLSAEQIKYSRRDAQVLIPLFKVLGQEIGKAGLWSVSDIELRALPAFVWLAQSGVQFDCDGWLALAGQAATRKAELSAKLDSLAPIKGDVGLFGPVEAWNWDSPQQCTEVLDQLGCPVNTTADAQLALIPGAFPAALREFRHQGQLVKMYGEPWLAAASIEKGRLYPNWRQIGTVSGRTSCQQPNVEQVPREPEYRRYFHTPPGRVLVKCDYAQLQSRIACNLSHDQALFEIFASGGDTHTATAQALLGRQKVSKQDRQIAKSANFLLTFAGSSEALRIYCAKEFGLELSEDEAKGHRDAFFRRYTGLAAWHRAAFQSQSRETRSTRGRRRLLPANAPPTWRLNTPAQADEADAAKTAMALLWERRQQVPSACPVLFNHDEIVIEADEAEAAKAWLTQAMLDAGEPILAPVPCAVEATICPTWGGQS